MFNEQNVAFWKPWKEYLKLEVIAQVNYSQLISQSSASRRQLTKTFIHVKLTSGSFKL